MKTKKLVLAGLFIALYVVLSFLAVNLQVMKISFAGLPVIIGAMIFGPFFGVQVGLIGALLEQILRYGITATTFLWILPVAARGLIVGIYAKKKKFNMTVKQMGMIMIVSAIAVTILNTPIIYLDSKIYGYYNFATVFGAVFFRIFTGIVTSIAYLAIVPLIVNRLSSLEICHIEMKKNRV